MDDPLLPNRILDQAALLAEYPGPDNLVWQDDHLLFTSGNAVLLLDGLDEHPGEAAEILRFESEVTAMAAAEDGSLAIGLGAAGVTIVGGAHDGITIDRLGGKRLISATALAFADPRTLFISVGSDLHAPGDWQRGLLEHRGSGALWRVDLDRSPPVCLADQLAFPSGLLLRGDNRIAVAETGRFRLLEFSTIERRAARRLVQGLPGYAGRLAPAPGGGAWLAIFALREKSRTASGRYGLALRFDGDFKPIASLHGGADGRRHGVTSCLEIRGELTLACRGGHAVISVDLAQGSES